MDSARLSRLELVESLTGGPGIFDIHFQWYKVATPNDVKTDHILGVGREDVTQQLDDYATANNLAWV